MLADRLLEGRQQGSSREMNEAQRQKQGFARGSKATDSPHASQGAEETWSQQM